MVATDSELRGRVVCRLPVLEDVRAAVRDLAVAAPDVAPAPAPAFVHHAPAVFEPHDSGNVAPGPVLVAQEDPAGAAPLARAGAAGRPRRAAKRPSALE